MFLKKEKVKYYLGIFLFLFVFTIGFVKINIAYSSLGIGTAVTVSSNDIYEEQEDFTEFSNVVDNSLIRIYEQDYGYDIKLKFFNNEKTYSLKLPWKNK